MSEEFGEYTGSVLAKSIEGQYYELKRWRHGRDGELEVLESRPLTLKQALLLLKGYKT